MENLLDIKDIHIPDGVSIFPLAKGWWVLVICFIALIILLKVFRRIYKTSKKFYALNKLKAINVSNPIDAGIQMSELLKRICNVKYREASVLYGREWLDFLNKHTSHKISSEASDLLIYAPFINKNEEKYTQRDATMLKDFCKNWIGENL